MSTSNGTRAKTFFRLIDPKTKALILDKIAKHYGITADEAYAEVTHDDAESLLDYITGPERTATSLMMKRIFNVSA